MVGREIVLPLGILGIVVKSPSVGGGDPPMGRFTCLVNGITLDWLLRRQYTKSLWISSGMNFLSLLHCFHQWCLPGRCMGIYPDLGGYNSVAEVWCGESDFIVMEMLGGMFYCVLKSLL